MKTIRVRGLSLKEAATIDGLATDLDVAVTVNGRLLMRGTAAYARFVDDGIEFALCPPPTPDHEAIRRRGEVKP
jgi:hypothetical protein